MALGKKIIEWNYEDQVKGSSTSEQLADGGFSPTTTGANTLTLPGIMYNPPLPIDHSTGLVGSMIASCEDPTGSYNRLFTSADVSQNGRFWSMDGAGTLTQRGSTDAGPYVQGKNDMIAFDGEAYATTNAAIVRWSSIGVSNTFNYSFFSFSDAFSPHPALTFNNFAYYGDGNLLLRQATAGATPATILTLPTSWVIVALGIDPGSGSMLISVIGQLNLSDTVNSGARIGFYDGFSNQVSRYVQVDDMVTAFAPTEGALYCSYGQNLGLWNGSGITFKRRMHVQFDNTQLMYKQHFTSVGSTLLFIERAKIIAYGPVRQDGNNIFYPVLTNTINGNDTDLTHIASIGQNQVAMSFATNQFFIWDLLGVAACPQTIISNNYNFDDELWVRRARVVYGTQVADGATPGSLSLYDQDGLITVTDDDGLYPLLNSKGFASAYKDIDNINLRLKEMTFRLNLNNTGAPSVVGSVVTTQSHDSVLSLPVSVTVPDGLTDSMIVVMVTAEQAGVPTGTCNGNSMSVVNFTTGNFYSRALYFQNPPAGVNSIVLNWLVFSHDIGVTAFVVQNAGAPIQPNQTSGSGTTATTAVVSTSAQSLYIEFIQSLAATQTPDTSQTSLSNFTITTSGDRVSSSYRVATYPGTSSMIVTLGSGVASQINGFTIPPAQSLINPGIQRVIFYGDPANITGTPN